MIWIRIGVFAAIAAIGILRKGKRERDKILSES